MSCLKITIQIEPNIELVYEVNATGTYNGFDTFEFEYFGTTYYIWHSAASPGDWNVTDTIGSGASLTSLKNNNDTCPEAEYPTWTPGTVTYFKTECTCVDGINCDVEDRHLQEFKSIKLPKVCVDEDRGITDCCCEYLILASASSNSWENDVTSAWIKLSENSDSVDFKLYKNNQLTTYQPTILPITNQENGYYCTIDWFQVLVLDGEGCFKLIVDYAISGISAAFTWGEYKVLPYSIQNALTTARIRAEFDGYHEIEGINFTGSGITSDLRFNGYIGNRQPNMQIDNLIYGNREMRRVIRENLNSYEIMTDPAHKCITQPMVDLYLLSENNLFISDYNAHNHDYCLDDVPVIVKESPEITYYDFSRKAKVTCIVEDKFKNKRTYY